MLKINICDKEYPDSLKKIKNPPENLYVEGDYGLLNYRNSITVIGSRNMSEYGKINTEKIVGDLVKSDVCIISGLAVGIDSVAHWTAINNGGKTIAVLGSGLNKVFPSENKELFRKIIECGGCVVSEYEPNVSARKEYFPKRNRIVSGLGLGVLVIEATYRSGTSITAKFAFEQNKKVYCLPNSLGSKNSAGTIYLSKVGGKIITQADEIIKDLEIDSSKLVNCDKNYLDEKVKFEEEQLKKLDECASVIYQYIKENGVINSERISNELNMSIQDVNVYLSMLELQELIVDNGMLNFSVSSKVSY